MIETGQGDPSLKFEYRNPKQIRNSKWTMGETRHWPTALQPIHGKAVSNLLFLNIRICFDFRISNFEFAVHPHSHTPTRSSAPTPSRMAVRWMAGSTGPSTGIRRSTGLPRMFCMGEPRSRGSCVCAPPDTRRDTALASSPQRAPARISDPAAKRSPWP